MGRYSYSGRLVAESLHTISIYYLRKIDYLNNRHYGSLTWSSNGEKIGSVGVETMVCESEKYLRLDYTITRRRSNEKVGFNYKIQIVETKCHFGGVRYWFKCGASYNGVYCGRRVAKLYQGGDYFACRHCYNLTYESRNENPTYRNYPFRQLIIYKKIEDLKETIKKRTYKGKSTKKMLRVARLQSKIAGTDVDPAYIDDLLYY